MKVTQAVILFTGFLLVVCSGLPAKKDEVEYVPIAKNPFGDQPIVDTGVISGWGGPFSNPFGGIFDNLEGLMDRMRQQISSLLKRFPLSRGNSSSEFPDFAFGAGGIPPFPKLGDIDLGKGNTTSVTKVIDGHKVVINETEYKKEDDFGGTFFKVRIIDVKSDSSELTTEKEAEAVPEVARDREEVENSFENEIPKSKEDQKANHTEHFDNIETFDEVDSEEPFDHLLANKNRFSSSSEWNELSPIESFEDNAIGVEEINKERTPELPIDLSRDTYVNEILAKNGAPINPDAEVFFVPEDPEKIKQIEKLINPR